MPVCSPVSLAAKARLFRGFSDPSRLAIVEALRDGPRIVSEVVEATGLAQSNVSNHLACLLGCGLVSRQPQGRFAVYRLSDPRVEQLLAGADDLLATAGMDACDGCLVPPAPGDVR